MLFVIMFLGAIISAVVASSKNRNAIGWFFVGGLFPLLGVILAIVLPANPAQEVTAQS